MKTIKNELSVFHGNIIGRGRPGKRDFQRAVKKLDGQGVTCAMLEFEAFIYETFKVGIYPKLERRGVWGGYSIAEDLIQMLPPTSYFNPYQRIFTLIHEAAHATGSAGRLDRPFMRRVLECSEGNSKAEYPLEELVAEQTVYLIGQTLTANVNWNEVTEIYLAGQSYRFENQEQALEVTYSHALDAALYLTNRFVNWLEKKRDDYSGEVANVLTDDDENEVA